VPYAESPREEFQGPTGEWFTRLRAIVHDGWLYWKHALPDYPLKGPIDESAARGITTLARRLHSAHMSFPEYRQLLRTPFAVGRWWDPGDATGEWNRGTRVLLRLDGYSSYRLATKLPRRLELQTRQCSENWLEIALPPGAELPVHSLDYDNPVAADGG
jgi:hypothetical protein